jgi:hypothetical protein
VDKLTQQAGYGGIDKEKLDCIPNLMDHMEETKEFMKTGIIHDATIKQNYNKYLERSIPKKRK